MSEWEELGAEGAASISIEQMDELVAKYREARDHYDKAKDIAKNLYEGVENAERMLVDALKASGREKYEAPGVALVYITAKEVYRVPPDIQTKRLLFDYIKGKYGEDVLTSMTSINHNSLNSWANKETESGEVMQIPGLEQPTIQETLSMRRK